MDFWISNWISGFFKVDFWISQWISRFQSGFLDFSLDFWISVWISANGVRDFFRDGPLGFSCLRPPRARSHALDVGGVCLKTGSSAEARCYAVAMWSEKISITSFCPCGQCNLVNPVSCQTERKPVSSFENNLC